MNKYMVVKVLNDQSICIPSTEVYANVELRSNSADFPEEIEALKLSAKNFNLDFDRYINNARISTIVEGTDINDAVIIADTRFEEILDLKFRDAILSNITLSDIGFIKNLETFELQDIKNNIPSSSMTFFIKEDEIQKYSVINFILLQNSDLSKRYIRSLHWLRRSRYENDLQLRILFNWFAVEALLKENEDDNVSGSILWFLGFPNNKSRQLISDRLLRELQAIPNYNILKKKLLDIIDEIRIFRNDSVHGGFRKMDFSNKHLAIYDQVMTLGISRCISAVEVAIINTISTVTEFKEYAPYIFEYNSNLVNDVRGNIVFTLSKLIQDP
ncbi:HEPN domain-containing protein [Francisellaceae bacterium CB300]